jgi:hypothetical protein
MLVTVRNYYSSVYPIKETSFEMDLVPRVDDLIHLHVQGRLATVKRVIWQITKTKSSVVLCVTGTNPEVHLDY